MNTPLTRKQVQKLPNGLNITREIIGYDDKTKQPICYPNRRERNARSVNRANVKRYQIIILESGKKKVIRHYADAN